MTAAILGPCAANAASTAARSLYGQDQGFRGRGCGDTGRARQRQGGNTRSGGGQQPVQVAVVAAGKLDDEVSAGEAAGQPDRRHGGLGAGGHHPDALGGRHALLHDGGEVGLVRRGCAEGQAAVHGGVNGLEDGRVGVTQQRRAPGADQVDVLGAVGVRQVRALGGDHKPRRPAHGSESPDGRIDAAGHQGWARAKRASNESCPYSPIPAVPAGAHATRGPRLLPGGVSGVRACPPACLRREAPPWSQTVRWSASSPVRQRAAAVFQVEAVHAEVCP